MVFIYGSIQVASQSKTEMWILWDQLIMKKNGGQLLYDGYGYLSK